MLVKTREVINTVQTFLDETEEWLQFGGWVWDLKSNVFTWTPGLGLLLGYPPGEIEAHTSPDLFLSHISEDHAAEFREKLNEAVHRGNDFTMEYIIRTKGGEAKTISTKAKVKMNESGEIEKIITINRDITAIRSFERDQERHIRELNRSNRDLEEFAYIASHDLQEPLRKISMFTERLKSKLDKELDQEAELFIERIMASAANMRMLIDNLLDFSRANRRSNAFERVDLNEVFQRVLSELELKISESKATINLVGTLPAISAVFSEMNQLFTNVLSNALKFRKQDQPVNVELKTSKIGKVQLLQLGLPTGHQYYRIDISDNGIGFESEYSEKIFQVFQRLNGKAEYPGSGIGLAICKKIVEKHNGLIFAKSEPDRGATFSIILPEQQS